MDDASAHECAMGEVIIDAFEMGFGAIILGLPVTADDANRALSFGDDIWSQYLNPTIVIWGDANQRILNLNNFTNISIVPEPHPFDLFLSSPSYAAVRWLILLINTGLLVVSIWISIKAFRLNGCACHTNNITFAGGIYYSFASMMVWAVYPLGPNYNIPANTFQSFMFYSALIVGYLIYARFFITWAKAVSQFLKKWLFYLSVVISYFNIIPLGVNSILGFFGALFPFDFWLSKCYFWNLIFLAAMVITQSMIYVVSFLVLLVNITKGNVKLSFNQALIRKVTFSALATFIGFLFAASGIFLAVKVPQSSGFIAACLVSEFGYAILCGCIFYTLDYQISRLKKQPLSSDHDDEARIPWHSGYIGLEDSNQ